MNDGIEQVTGTWQGMFHRCNIDGKRRIMVFSSNLYRMLGIQYPKHADWLSSIFLRTGLRDGIDYQHGRNASTNQPDTHLSISAVQALLVVVNSDQSWKLHNQLSDLINRGFSNDERKNDDAANHRNRNRSHPLDFTPAPTALPFEPKRSIRRDKS
jgi:hypothetical protein